MQVDAIVSLGGNCVPTWHIRRHFNIERAGLLDWWIVPFAGLLKLIEDGPSQLFTPQDTMLLPDRDAVVSRSFGFVFYHDFPRDADRRVIEASIAEKLDGLREKYMALWRRLDETCASGASVLFVRARRDTLVHEKVPIEQGDSEFGRGDLGRLCRAIAARWPAARAKVLYLNFDQRTDDPMAVFDQIEELNDVTTWAGSTGGWDAMFHRQDLLLTPTVA